MVEVLRLSVRALGVLGFRVVAFSVEGVGFRVWNRAVVTAASPANSYLRRMFWVQVVLNLFAESKLNMLLLLCDLRKENESMILRSQ